jgi:6-pyruvoyltetrahydropterin/6-carboxytetrahydropterin synthase
MNTMTLTTAITYEFEFQAAHQLHWHSGQCRSMHGHSYRCELTFGGPLDENGVVVDFDQVGVFVDEKLMSRLDHTYLNDVLDNPTAERIAASIFEVAETASLPIVSVRLWETRTCSAVVRRA